MGPEPKPQCTPLSALYEIWRRTIIEKDMRKPVETVSDEAFDRHVKLQRENVIKGLSDRFYQIAHWSDAKRAQEKEWVLWEDQEIMVLVDNRARAPKALVVPKQQGIWVLSDALQPLQKRLGQVAAITSDAFMDAQGKACQQGNFSKIYFHPPRQRGIRQVHIHIKPSWSLGLTDPRDFYRRVSERLAEKLAGRRRSG